MGKPTEKTTIGQARVGWLIDCDRVVCSGTSTQNYQFVLICGGEKQAQATKDSQSKCINILEYTIAM